MSTILLYSLCCKPVTYLRFYNLYSNNPPPAALPRGSRDTARLDVQIPPTAPWHVDAPVCTIDHELLPRRCSLSSTFQSDEVTNWVIGISIPCGQRRTPCPRFIGTRSMPRAHGESTTRVVVPLLGYFCATRVVMNVGNTRSTFIVMSSSSKSSPPNTFLGGIPGAANHWRGDIIIIAERTNSAGQFIDLDPFLPTFVRLIAYLSTVGDFHRRVIRSGGQAVKHFGVLYVPGRSATP